MTILAPGSLLLGDCGCCHCNCPIILNYEVAGLASPPPCCTPPQLDFLTPDCKEQLQGNATGEVMATFRLDQDVVIEAAYHVWCTCFPEGPAWADFKRWRVIYVYLSPPDEWLKYTEDNPATLHTAAQGPCAIIATAVYEAEFDPDYVVYHSWRDDAPLNLLAPAGIVISQYPTNAVYGYLYPFRGGPLSLTYTGWGSSYTEYLWCVGGSSMYPRGDVECRAHFKGYFSQDGPSYGCGTPNFIVDCTTLPVYPPGFDVRYNIERTIGQWWGGCPEPTPSPPHPLDCPEGIPDEWECP